MKIHAITVCADYDDFLAAALPANLPLLDSLTVVTTHEDRDTQRLCKKWGVRCLPTDVMRKNGEAFNKAAGIRYALANTPRQDWLLHLDADIALPPTMRLMLQNAELDESCIYGCDRVNVPSWEEWQTFLRSPGPVQYEWSCMVHPPRNWRLGSRIAHGDYGGYCPIGFFQLWHGSAGRNYPPLQNADAEHTDVLHAIQWPRPKRILLPEFYVYHLESGPAKMGANWKGRKTPRFGPPAAIKAAVQSYSQT